MKVGVKVSNTGNILKFFVYDETLLVGGKYTKDAEEDGAKEYFRYFDRVEDVIETAHKLLKEVEETK